MGDRGDIFLHKAGFVLHGTDNGLAKRSAAAYHLTCLSPSSSIRAAGSGPGMWPPEALLMLLKQHTATAAAALRFFSPKPSDP